MFVRIIPESSPIELSNGYLDFPLPAANVELLPFAMELLASSEKDLNFWDFDLAHLAGIDISLHS